MISNLKASKINRYFTKYLQKLKKTKLCHFIWRCFYYHSCDTIGKNAIFFGESYESPHSTNQIYFWLWFYVLYRSAQSYTKQNHSYNSMRHLCKPSPFHIKSQEFIYFLSQHFEMSGTAKIVEAITSKIMNRLNGLIVTSG